MLLLDAEALSPAALIARWRELVLEGDLVDDELHSAEMDQYGELFVSPKPVNRHQLLAGLIANQLRDQLGSYSASSELSILTPIGVRNPDAIWTREPDAFMDDPAVRAPEICVEVASPGNTRRWLRQKAAAYLDAGAREVILVELDGRIRYLTADGESAVSTFGLTLTLTF